VLVHVPNPALLNLPTIRKEPCHAISSTAALGLMKRCRRQRKEQIMNRQQVLPLLVTVTLIVFFLTNCGASSPAPVAEAPAAAATISLPTTIPQTPTPTLPSGPKPGHWEGIPSISFDVSADGKITNFAMTLSSCKVAAKALTIAKDNTFVLSETTPMNPMLEIGFKTIKQPVPEVTKTASGDVVETGHVNGKFDSATTLTGTYKILVCKGPDTVSVALNEGSWKAEWKSP
jgi:hypothetical protein